MKNFANPRSTPFVHLAFFICFTLGIGPWFLATEDMMDGSAVQAWLATGDFSYLQASYLDGNWWLTVGIFVLIRTISEWSGLPFWLLGKLFLSLLAFGIAWESHHKMIRWIQISAEQARLYASLTLVLPIWHVFFAYTMCMGHIAAVYLALLGHRMTLNASAPRSASGWIAIVVSFQLMSNAGLVLAMEIVDQYRRQQTNKIRKIFFGRIVLIVVLGVMVYVVAWKWIGTSGHFIGYNQPRSPLTIAELAIFGKIGISYLTWIAIYIPLIFYWTFLSLSSPKLHLRKTSYFDWSAVLWIGFLYIFSVAAYLAIRSPAPLWLYVPSSQSQTISLAVALGGRSSGLVFWFGHWHSRNLLPALLPFVLFFAWIGVSITNQRLGSRESSITRERSHLQVWAIAFAGMIIWSLAGHYARLERLAIEAQVEMALRTLPEPRSGIVAIEVTPTIKFRASPVESNLLLRRVYGAERWISYIVPMIPSVQEAAYVEAKRIGNTDPNNRQNQEKVWLLSDLNWHHQCSTTIRLRRLELSFIEVLRFSGYQRDQVPSAEIMSVKSRC